MSNMNKVILLLGSNLGDSENNIEVAISKINKYAGKVVKKSKILKTLPVEFDSPYIFCNIAVILYTTLSPVGLLRILKGIEMQMGRKLDSKFYGEYRDRVIDIDIVVYDEINFKSVDLQIPHYKHLYDRIFSRELLENISYL